MVLLLASGLVPAQDVEDVEDVSGQINASSNPDQLYQLGVSALTANKPELARQALERVVVLKPGFAGAWLDLAMATAQSGDTAAAVEHLEYLRIHFTLPPALANQVSYFLSIWQNIPAQPPTTSGWQGEVLLALGYDTNANTGLARQQIPLSLAAGSTLFDVDKAYQPRADRFSTVGISIGGPARPIWAGQISPLLLLRSKQLFREGDFNTLDLQSGLSYQTSAGTGTAEKGNWQVNLFAQHYRLGGQALYNGVRIAAQHTLPWLTCQTSTGAEIETRHHQRVSSLGGNLYSVSAGMSCPLSSGDKKSTLSTTVKAGFEQVRLDRPGGNNRSAEVTVRYEQALSDVLGIQAVWQAGGTADLSGYSPLLENNEARRLKRQAISLGIRRTITREWEARINVEYFRQRANLPLFDQNGSLVMFGVARRFN